jgi:hypothetical protein
MLKKTSLTLIACLAAIPAAAQQFQYVDVAALKAASAALPAPKAAPAASRARNYYLELNSYDPLLEQPSREGQKLHIIGGTIDIPGVNGTLDFARAYRQAAYQRHDIQSDVALAVYTKNLPKVLFQVLFGIAEDNGNPNGGTYSDINPVVQDPPVAMPT